MYKRQNIMSLLRDMNPCHTTEYFCLATKVLTKLEFYHVVRHCVNVCDIIFSTYDKFLACDVTSLIYCLAGTGDLLGKYALRVL